jgi:hypothetical protein
MRSTLPLLYQVLTNRWETATRIELQLNWGGIPNSHPGILCKGNHGSPLVQLRNQLAASISASTLRDYPSARTIRTFKSPALGLTLRLPSEANFILTDSRPEVSYSASWSVSRPGQLRERHAFKMTRGRTTNRSLIDTDGVTANRQASVRSLFQIKTGSFPW